MRMWKINLTFLTFWTDKAVLPHLALKFLLSQTRAWNRFPHESMHLPAARWWKLALRGEMEVYCCIEPARGSLIKLSPGSWNVISSFVIQARIICLHFACDGLLDNNGLGPDDAEAVLMAEGSRRSQTVTEKTSDLSHLEIGNEPENFFSINLPFKDFFRLTSPSVWMMQWWQYLKSSLCTFSFVLSSLLFHLYFIAPILLI